ncbi:hypothetical protein [Phenylobacterium sp.]|uniref:hypothetical protein n=1 Tax=Phenylobacterium sp. TaxID=1871053 RepID=UPI0025F34B90|nr:hypothetical protein [Phenylobacterium sp.]
MLIAALALLAAATGASAPTGLAGEWVVDLSTKSSGPYSQPMVLRLGDDGVVTGTFYNSEIQAGRWKTDRGRTCASFRTTDGAGPYHTSVCLNGAQAVGQTWAEHRNFLFNWNADRKLP